MGRLAPPLGIYSLGHIVPLDDEHDVGDIRALDRAGERGHDGVVVDGDAVAGAVTDAGHVAAGDGGGDEALGGLVGAGGDLSTAAYAQSKAELVAVDLLTGEGSLVAESGEVPALSGADADGGDADRAVGVVGDLAVGGGDNSAVVAHGHGQGGRDGDAHAGRGDGTAAAFAAANAVVGGREVYGAGGAAAAGRDVVGARADSETEHHAEREQHGNGLTKSFSHVSTSKKFRFVALIQGR